MDIPVEFMRAAKLLPTELRKCCLEAPPEILNEAEELRLRVGQPPGAVVRGEQKLLSSDRIVTAPEIQLTVEIATRASMHSYGDSIRAGYITAEGGCRLGLCGTAVTEGEQIGAIRRLTSLCIRIPREKKGCADDIFPRLLEGGFGSTLIISPPGGGKTTLLRELIRLLSLKGYRVSLADERGEVAGVFEGRPCFDLGPATDILTGAPKAVAAGMLLRAMAPQVLAFDEITETKDVKAAFLASNCGVELLATAHAGGTEDLRRRPLYRELLEGGVFKRTVIIGNCQGRRYYTVEELT